MPATLITVAPTGAETVKADHPVLPVTPSEIGATARDCQVAGAAMIHLHARDANARPTLDLGILGELVAAVREAGDLIVQLSTGGAVTDPFEDRLRVLELAPESCSLTLGTVNFGDDVFHNPWWFIVELYRRTQAMGVLPEFEIFDLGHVATLQRLLDAEGAPASGHVHCDLVCGVPGGMSGDPETVLAVAQRLPRGATWSATGVGRTTLPVLLTALAAGGHLRVGLEDTLSYLGGRPARDNAELVERAATLAGLAARPAMTPAEARTVLHIRSNAEGATR